MTTLLYDQDCGFCRTVLGAILMRDRERVIRPVALQDALAADLLPGMSEEDRFASFHLVDDDCVVRSGGEALPLMMALLRRGRLLGRLMSSAQPLTNAAYYLISDHRSELGPRVPEGWTRRADLTIRRREAELGGDPAGEAAKGDLAEAPRVA